MVFKLYIESLYSNIPLQKIEQVRELKRLCVSLKNLPQDVHFFFAMDVGMILLQI